MSVCRITTLMIERRLAAVPPAAVERVFDVVQKGFFVEFRPSGGASFGYRWVDVRRYQRQRVIGRVGQMDLSEARAAAQVLAAQISAGLDLSEVGPSTGLTLQRFAVEHYLPHARLNKRSWRTDEAILRNHLLPALGTLRLDQIRSQDVRALQHRMVIDGAAAGSVNRRLVLLAHLFACAARWGLIDEGVNPVRAVEALPDHGARERFLSPEESHRLLLELVAEPNRGVANLVLLLMLTGARRSEIALARWPDVDLDRRLLRVPLSKSGKPRHIVLSQAAVDCIRALPRKPGCDWLLPNPRSGRPLTGVFEVWSRVRERAGLPGLRLHDLRHSYASFLVNAGRSLYEVQALLGHANPRTTMRYAHLSQATLRDAADQVGRILAMSSPSNAPPLTTVPH